MLARITILAAGLAVMLPGAAVAKPPAAQDAAVVCNEAENSHRGGYTVTGGPVDLNPPAFLRGSQMRVGKGAGLEDAAERSPALRLCGPVTDPVDPDYPGDGDGEILL